MKFKIERDLIITGEFNEDESVYTFKGWLRENPDDFMAVDRRMPAPVGKTFPMAVSKIINHFIMKNNPFPIEE